MAIKIRLETVADKAAIRNILISCFDTDLEAKLVEQLRVDSEPFISLLAIDSNQENKVIGVVVFSPMSFNGADFTVDCFGLAPFAVLPSHQSQGIGAQLVRTGINECRSLGAKALAVLGDPNYYQRFGFEDAARYGMESVYKDLPPGAFMLNELQPGWLNEKHGVVHYHPAFNLFF